MNQSLQGMLARCAYWADKAEQKGLEICNRARISLRISEISVQVDRQYSELGKLTYKSISYGRLDMTEEMLGIRADIAENLNRIRLLKAELAQIKGETLCAGCCSGDKPDSGEGTDF